MAMTHDSVPEGWREGPKRLLAVGLALLALSLALAVSYNIAPAEAETAETDMAILFWSLVAGGATTAVATGWGIMTARESRSE